ncbi:hypothetical protein L3Q72_04610 [Vibrio sp. JC009]|uniref:hypothetical protein n=1 Tax=Vibrio sp. JC009 TaxID=2912314 RepID=UPI0023AF7816|nr:hypothetical protein [Vibrio sp. JC009]WED22687.1 hypothetical protein L3Q72_04610 [Vibrio sp. JC009]
MITMRERRFGSGISEHVLMKKVFIVLFMIVLSFNASALSIKAWWEICSEKTSSDSTCLLSVSSMENGIKYQAIASFSDHSDLDKNDKIGSALWLGFCWEASMKDNWAVKYQLFKGHIADLYYSDHDLSNDVAFEYLHWFRDRYRPTECLN